MLFLYKPSSTLKAVSYLLFAVTVLGAFHSVSAVVGNYSELVGIFLASVSPAIKKLLKNFTQP